MKYYFIDGNGVIRPSGYSSLKKLRKMRWPPLDAKLPEMMVQMLVHQSCPLLRR